MLVYLASSLVPTNEMDNLGRKAGVSHTEIGEPTGYLFGMSIRQLWING